MNNPFFHSMQTEPLPPPLSEEYSDIIVRRQFLPPSLEAPFYEQTVDTQFSILYAPLSENLTNARTVGYYGVPKLFSPLNTTSLESSGILAAQNQPYLALKGEGTLVGFLDFGIDYRHPAFRNPDGSTRILGIWDQTGRGGPPPDGLSYGTAYTAQQINEALLAPDPYQVVPIRDETGHGTAVAGIACGSADPDSDFTGAAPLAGILFVRLKPAKQYLRDYFLIPEDAQACQENDLMLGVRYLISSALGLRRPLVICMAFGSSQGGHTGNTPLEEVLNNALLVTGIYAVTGTGNEAGAGHHFFGKLSRRQEELDVEILVNGETAGFTAEFWSDPLDLYSIGFLSPLGESVQPVYYRPVSSQEFRFSLEDTVIYVYYSALELQSGQQLAMIRMIRPSVGLWRLRVVSQEYGNGAFHLWLPVTGLVSDQVRFLSPEPDTTLVIPSCAELPVSVGTCNAYNGSLFFPSGRGYPRTRTIKPELASPGVDLSAPSPGGSYLLFSGSSAAAALAAGSAALLAEWGLRDYQSRYLSARELKSLLILGASRSSSISYPNQEWGYGTLNLYRIFQTLGQLSAPEA